MERKKCKIKKLFDCSVVIFTAVEFSNDQKIAILFKRDASNVDKDIGHSFWKRMSFKMVVRIYKIISKMLMFR